MISIGLLDNEEDYVRKLAAYLNRQGRGKWNIVAFTNGEILDSYMKKRRLDILAGTNERVLTELQREHGELVILWLRDEEQPFGRKEGNCFFVCRYQGAGVIEEGMRKIISQMDIHTRHTKRIVAMYSPVGRCGKTELALEIARDERYGKWLYIGMEDYSFFGDDYREEEKRTESFLYYIKEREKAKLLSLIEGSSGIIPSAFSPFDTRRMEKEDFKWFIEIFREYYGYNGILFDFGTGVIQDFETFLLFDFLLVPYLTEEKSIAKKEKLERLLEAYGLEEIKKGIKFLNMQKKEDVREKLDKLFTVA